MQLGRLDVQDVALTVGGHAAGLLGQESHGVALVQQAQLALRIVAALRVHVDAALQHVAVEVRHQRADVARRERQSLGRAVFLTVLDVLLHALRELQVLALVHRIDLAVLGNADVLVRQREHADARVIGEAVHAIAGGVDQHRGRTIHHIARGHLRAARLQKVFQRHRRAHRRHPPVDGKDGAHRHVHVDVGRTVQRIGQHDVLGIAVLLAVEGDEVLFLFRRKACHVVASKEGRADRLVREHVQFLLLLALHVLGAGVTQNLVNQTSPIDVTVDDLGRQSDGRQNAAQIAAGMRVLSLLLDDEFTQTLHGSLLLNKMKRSNSSYCN